MIFYKSTRGEDKNLYSFSEAVLQGIAQDGGLLVPEEIPHVSSEQLKILIQTSYQEKAIFVLKQFQTDLSEYTLKRIVDTAYANNYDNPWKNFLEIPYDQLEDLNLKAKEKAESLSHKVLETEYTTFLKKEKKHARPQKIIVFREHLPLSLGDVLL